MDDTIYRQDAFDALNGCTEIFLNNLPPTIDRADAVEAIKALPSAQPTGTNTVQVDDCISREAAVEVMRKAKDKSEAHRILMQLPSAQKYGTWIVSHFGANAKCSKCGMYCVGAYDHDRCDQYCRCCGAKMDGLKLEGEEP